jgi:hypothetical protein
MTVTNMQTAFKAMGYGEFCKEIVQKPEKTQKFNNEKLGGTDSSRKEQE